MHSKATICFLIVTWILCMYISFLSSTAIVADAAGIRFSQPLVRSVYTARLASGKPSYNVFGDLIGYYIFAEAGAVVTPFPQWEIFSYGRKQTIYEKMPPIVANPSRKKKRANGKTYTRSETMTRHSHSKTLKLQRTSAMSWFTLSHPFGAPPVTGSRHIYANTNDRFVISDWVFSSPGRYNMLLNVSLYWGPRMQFNVSLIVDPQPGKIVMTQYPAGYNGSFLTTEPQAQLQDLLGNPVRVATPVVTFKVLSGPPGYQVLGTASAYPASTGLTRLPQVILTQPGKYVVVLVAKRTDGVSIQTPTFSLTVLRALPTAIVTLTQAIGVTRAVFFVNPMYRIIDQIGFSQDSRVNITLSLGLNQPSVVYVGHDTQAMLNGVTSRVQSGFDFVFPGLYIDLPGNYEIVATLYLDGVYFMQTKYGIVVADMPTFAIPAPMEVNQISVLTVKGSQPQIQPLYLKMSNELACVSSASDTAAWGREGNIFTTVRNVSFVPFASGKGKYLCISLPTQDAFVPLLKFYDPAFNEPYPLNYVFEIVGVSTCRSLTSTDEYLYRTAGWTSAVAGRSYGCHLSPPVSGTIAPCDCFFILTCAEFRHTSFTPPNLDIGLCVCCKGWVLVIAGLAAAGFFSGLIYVIYIYV